MVHDTFTGINAQDVIVMANFRADRMKQITKALHDRCPSAPLYTFTEYDRAFNLPVLFPKKQPEQTLGECLSVAGKKQLRIAESDKYAHVTYFFNGGCDVEFVGEKRLHVPSPKVNSYALCPEMSLPAVIEKLCTEISGETYDFIVLNIANGDQVGHSGDVKAAIQAVECIDTHVGKIVDALKQVSGEMILIADHGNCEQMTYADGTPHAAHTLNPVPCLYIGRAGRVDDGTLADVAPSVLSLLNMRIPEVMTGKNLIEVFRS